MFAATKPKLSNLSTVNSRNKFVDELHANESKLLNQSFDTASKMLQKNDSYRQTKLCLRPVAKRPHAVLANEVGAPKQPCVRENPPKAEVFLMPVPNAKSSKMSAAVKPKAKQEDQNTSVNKKADASLAKSNPHNVALLGKVDFCFKMQKTHPEIKALWTAYGKLIKITAGKQRGEHILLLRNESGGPVVQSIYYDFNNLVSRLEIGCYLRVVGRFIGENRLQTFKVQEIDVNEWNQDFNRIQNVISFALLQQSMSNESNTNKL